MPHQNAHEELTARFARNIDWNLFKVFHEIVLRGGVGAAGRKLNRQQPSVSAALQRLESYCGERLCDRTSQGITLTRTGERVFAACDAIYKEAVNVAETSLSKDELAGTITLRVISNLHLVPALNDILGQFHHDHPKIDIKLEVSAPFNVIRAVKSGAVELGIGFCDDTEHDLFYLPVTAQLHQLYCGRPHPLFGTAPAEPAALKHESFILNRSEPDEHLRYRADHGLGRQIGAEADSLQERIWLTRLGMGIAFLPKPVVDCMPFRDELWPLLPESEAPVTHICFIAAAKGPRSAAAERLIKTATDFFLTRNVANTTVPL